MKSLNDHPDFPFTLIIKVVDSEVEPVSITSLRFADQDGACRAYGHAVEGLFLHLKEVRQREESLRSSTTSLITDPDGDLR